MLRLSPGANLWAQFRHNRVFLPLGIVLFMYLIQQLLALASWFVIGRGFFQGNFDLGWLFAWMILLFATIPVSILVNDAQTELSMNVGSIFKQRLLHGTLQLEPVADLLDESTDRVPITQVAWHGDAEVVQQGRSSVWHASSGQH